MLEVKPPRPSNSDRFWLLRTVSAAAASQALFTVPVGVEAPLASEAGQWIAALIKPALKENASWEEVEQAIYNVLSETVRRMLEVNPVLDAAKKPA